MEEVFAIFKRNILWYPFILYFNEQQILQKNLAMIISLETALRRYSAKISQNWQKNPPVPESCFK